jgi:hypothetical protein
MKRKKILKMKLQLSFVSFLFWVIVGFLLLPSSTKGSCRINDISLEKMGKFTKLTIYADQPFEFVHSTLEEKDGKPYRVIIDCKNAIFNLPQHNFKKDLPSGTIKAIRTSQFQTEPERIVRIVLDLDKPVIYKVAEKGEDQRGAIAILTAQEPDFPFWAATKREKASSEGKLASSISLEKTAKEISEAEDNLLTSSENRSRFDFEQSENAKGEEVKKRTTFEKPLSFADTSEINIEKEISQVSIAKPETEKKDAKIRKKVSGQTDEKMVLATSATSPEVFSSLNRENKKLQSAQGEDKEAETNVEKDASKSSSKHLGKKEYIQEEPLLSQAEAISSADEVEKTTKEPPEENKTDSLNLPAKEGKVALLSPEEKSTKQKAGSPESLAVISKPEGTVLELVPQRGIIHYHGEGKRDPFVPLTERISAELGEIPLPTFESLKLVGVLKDETGNRALLEDERGYGYIMKNGDKIKNGYVVSVEDNKVIFQIQEYGWSRTIALELTN